MLEWWAQQRHEYARTAFFAHDFSGEVGSKRSQDRGLLLLKENLAPVQLQQYDKYGYFDVVGGKTGKRYRIRHGRQMNIEQLDKNGRRVCGWCFYPQGALVAGDLGIPVETVGRALQTMLGGQQITRFKKDGEQYDVIVQVAPRDRSRPNDISDIYVRARDGSMVQLANVVNVLEGVSPSSLNHFQRLRAVTITSNLAPGYTIGDALTMMDQTARRVLPPDALTDVNGQSREFRQATGSFYLTLALALIFIYLVLAAQFESFADPFVIMLSVPLSAAGALFALWATGGTWNIYSQIGMITLIGLITKHGILIVEFANQLQERGEKLFDAIRHSAELRLRPILMTTGAMVLGALPLAMASGAGAESRIQIGWVIVGGLTFGTLLTLYVVPTMYTLMEQALGKWMGSHHHAEPGLIADSAARHGAE